MKTFRIYETLVLPNVLAQIFVCFSVHMRGASLILFLCSLTVLGFSIYAGVKNKDKISKDSAWLGFISSFISIKWCVTLYTCQEPDENASQTRLTSAGSYIQVDPQ